MAVGTAAPETTHIDGERTGTARTVLIQAALLGLLADGVIRNAPDGLGWTLWVIALSLAAVNVARRRELHVTAEQGAWLVAAITFAAAFAWRDAEGLRVANVLATLVALALFSMAAVGRPAASLLVARLRDVITAGVYAVRDIVAGAPMLVALESDLLSLPAVRGAASWTALRVVLITLPLVVVFTALLSRADPVFASVFRLPTIDVERIATHAIVAGAFAWWSAGWIRGALLGVSRRPALPDRLPIQLGVAEITTSLGSVITLFMVFVALQLRWLFGGAEVVLATTGLTVAEYARRGFFELVAVAALVIPLILGTRAVIENDGVVRRHRQLSLVLIGLVAAIMVSALLRMQLYVGYFGLTTDRLYATALMLWLGLVSLALARTVLRGWSRPFAAMTVLSGFAGLFALNVVNPDLLVARVNLGRAAVDRGIDYPYLARLSGDALPVVTEALNAAVPSLAACEAARLLRTRWVDRARPAWNLGTRRGRAAVVRDITPGSVQRLCAGVPSVVTPAAPASVVRPAVPGPATAPNR